MNIQKVSNLSARGGDTEYNNVRKRGAPSHEEDSEYLSKKARQASYALAWLKGKADRHVRTELEEEHGHEEARGIEIVGGVSLIGQRVERLSLLRYISNLGSSS